MAGNAQAYAQMLTSVAQRVTGSYQGWISFLKTAGQVYKYPFPDQLMIYAQRPDATACAEYDFWNYQMRRYVRRGSKGIALVDTSGNRPVLRYVFDVSDTGGEEHTRPRLWTYRDEHQKVVSAALAQRYGVPDGDDLPEQFEKIASQLAEEYWIDHQQDIIHIVDGSFLEEYDTFNIGVQFKNAAAVSIAYVLMSRCGLEPDQYFEHVDFLNVFDFNTPTTVTELGTAVSMGSETVLRQIEVTIKKYEREKSAERSADHGKQPDLHAGGRFPAPRPDPGRTASEGPGQVRADAPDLSEGAPSGPVQPAGNERNLVQPSAGDRGHSQQPSGTDDAGAGKDSGRNGGPESQRADGVGGPDEQLQGSGGGNHHVGVDLQLNTIPSEREQIETIQEAESADVPSAFAVPMEPQKPPIPVSEPMREVTQADIDAAIQEWNGDIASKRRVQQYMADYARDKGTAVWLKEEYGDSLPAFPVTVDGAATDLPWPKVQRHLARLVKEDRFFTETEQLAGQDTNTPVATPPTVREIYEHYKPIVKELVLADEAYQNACKNNDQQTARLEGDEAVKRAALIVMGPDFNLAPDFMRQYFDLAEFHLRLHREIVDETYPILSQPQQEQADEPS